MKKNKFLKSITLLTIAIAAILGSCVDNDFDTPASREIPIGQVVTVAQLKSFFTDSGAVFINSAVGNAYEFKRDITVYATVTMDDKTGNLYEMAYIQDPTGGIALKFDVPGGIQEGDTVRLNVKGLIINQYARAFQINAIHGEGFKKENYITTIDVNKFRTPEIATIAQITNAANKPYYQGRLVKIENTQFVTGDTMQTYADYANFISRNLNIEEAGGATLLVRTSGYASFADEKSPKGNGSIIGVMGQYNNDMQLQIRTTSEVVMTSDRFGGGGGGTATGTGTKDDPYNVAGAIANNTGVKQWVKGYIVGAAEYISGTGNVFHFDSPFGSVNTNIFIADDPNETSSENVVVVQLPSGTIRDILNLVSNSANYKKEVMVRGSLEDYFGQPGMKETIGCIIDETEYGETTDVEAILYEDFSSITPAYAPISIPGWKVVMETGTIDWHGDGYNGQSAEISAYGSTDASNIAWLITPAVNLSATTAPYLSFYSALKYFVANQLSVYVSTDYDGGNSPQSFTWTQLTSANIVETSDPVDAASGYYYTVSGNVDLSAYKATTVYIAFKYVGSSTLTTKYRVDNVKIAD